MIQSKLFKHVMRRWHTSCQEVANILFFDSKTLLYVKSRQKCFLVKDYKPKSKARPKVKIEKEIDEVIAEVAAEGH